MGAVFGSASILGPVLGGFFTDHLTWRWVFYINLPLGVAAVFVTAAVLPAAPARAAGTKVSVDYLGILLLSTAVTCIVLLTTWGGTMFPWSSVTMQSLGAVCVGLLVAFAFWQRRAADPLIPPALFANRTFRIAASTSFIIGFAMFGAISFLPVFMQVVSGATATSSGLFLVPLMTGLLAASILSGRRISQTGRYKRYPLCGTVLATLGMALFSTMNEDTPRALSGLYMAIAGIGIGLTMQVMVMAMQNTMERRYLGVATSTVTFFRSVGGSCGVALFGAIFNGRLAVELARTSVAGVIAGQSPRGGGLLKLLATMLPAQRHEVAAAFARSLSTSFLTAAPCLAGAFVLVMLLEEKPLRGREAPVEAAPLPVAEPTP